MYVQGKHERPRDGHQTVVYYHADIFGSPYAILHRVTGCISSGDAVPDRSGRAHSDVGDVRREQARRSAHDFDHHLGGPRRD